MQDAGYIMSFDSSSGLDPKVVSKLNNNFWLLSRMFTDPEIVMVAGTSFPTPRTNETMFYNTTTGELYIWYYHENFDPNVYPEPYWGWKPIDIGAVHFEDASPSNSSYVRQREFIWYDTSAGMIYFYFKPSGQMSQGWWSIEDVINNQIVVWLGHADNINLLKALLGIS